MAKPKSRLESLAVRVWDALWGPLWQASVEEHLKTRVVPCLAGRESDGAAIKRLSGCGKETVHGTSCLERIYSLLCLSQFPERHGLGSSCQTRISSEAWHDWVIIEKLFFFFHKIQITESVPSCQPQHGF